MPYNQKQYPLYNPILIRMTMGSGDFVVNYVEMLDESCVEFRHVHKDGYEIYYCIEGSQHLMVEDKCYSLMAGDFLFLRPGVSHYTIYEPKTPKRYAVYVFSVEKTNSSKQKGKPLLNDDNFALNTMQFFENKLCFIGHDETSCSALLAKIQQEIEDPKPGGNLMINTLYQQYLLTVLRNMQQETDPESQHQHDQSKVNWTIKITKYMRANYNKNISVQDIADTFFLSPRHVNRIFSEFFGESFKRTLNIYRLNYAKNYLIDTDYSVEKISELVGLSSPKMLYQLFEEVEGISLSEYRHRVRERNASAIYQYEER